MEEAQKKGLWKQISHKVYAIYDKDYKKLLVLPILLLILSFAQIGYQMATTGDFVNKGVGLKGGVTVTVMKADILAIDIEELLTAKLPQADLSVRDIVVAGANKGVMIEGSDVEYTQIITVMSERYGTITEDDYTVEEMGSTLGESFFKETIFAVLIAFLCMSIVVFVTFRLAVPSAMVVLAAFSTIVETLAVFNLLGFTLSTAGVAAFLMLIGYSVDTDILLSSRVLKRKEGTVLDRVVGAVGTGLLMSITTMTAVTVGIIFTQSAVIREIMIIILIGMVFDILNTWIQNAGLLRMYFEKKHHKAD